MELSAFSSRALLLPSRNLDRGLARIRSFVRDHRPGSGHHIPELAQVAADGFPQSTTATTTEPGASYLWCLDAP
ncbi:hypothetical protein B0T09DRAFT_350262 [Sordaria sp. MPI-SDFR-AT-0083]|nr:hypothetical protein B0T09DRAFT_350262 [Sordaria sp. MPI-SDFR-AT-0083]